MPWDTEGGKVYRQPIQTDPDKFVSDKEILRIMGVIGVPKRYRQCRLREIPEGAEYRAALRIFVETLTERDKNGDGLILFGSYGSGKTGGAVSVLSEAIKRGCRCRFVSARDLGRIGFDFESEQRKRWAELRRYQLVVIDEIAVEKGTTTSHEGSKTTRATEDLIRHRYDNQLMTIITTNAGPRLLTETYPDLSSLFRHSYRSALVSGIDWRGE